MGTSTVLWLNTCARHEKNAMQPVASTAGSEAALPRSSSASFHRKMAPISIPRIDSV